MRAHLPSIARDRRGISTVEFALAAPLFFTLLFGCFNIGIAFMARSGLSHAVNEAARFATIFPSPTDAELVARTRAVSFGIDPTALIIETSRGRAANDVDYVDLNGSYTYHIRIPFFPDRNIVFRENRRVWLQPDID